MPGWIFYLILLELIFVSYGDIRYQKIPNLWSIFNIVFFVVLLFSYPDIYRLEFQTLFYSFVFLAVGFFLFLLKIMGGGDAKFLFSIYLLIPVVVQDKSFEALLLATILIGSFVFLTNLTRNFSQIIDSIKIRDLSSLKKYFGTKFSFAPVILISWIWLGWQLGIVGFWKYD